MIKNLLLFLCTIICCFHAIAQDSAAAVTDSAAYTDDLSYYDSLPAPEPLSMADSLNGLALFHPPALPSAVPVSNRFWLREVYAAKGWFGFAAPNPMISNKREVISKDLLFYVLAGIILFFAFLRAAFPKYISDLFRLFFRTTLKQRQISEQLVANPVPSLLLNLFFLITGGLYVTFLLFRYTLAPVQNFWLLYGYVGLLLLGIYLSKFVALKIVGWIFGMSRAADAYIFVIFMINKIMGIFLLPIIIGMAFTTGVLNEAILVISYFGVAGIFLYRFLYSYRVLHSQIRINPLYFFLYLCAFEVAPLFLIYKLIIPVF